MARRQRRSSGLSLAELLVVTAMFGLAILVVTPLVSHQIRRAQVRSAASQFAADLSAARMIAVTTRRDVDVRVTIDPANRYEFPDARGRRRRTQLPEGIRIVSSTSPIGFRPDGSVPGGAVTVLESVAAAGVVDRWTVRTGVLGLARTVHERLETGEGRSR